MMLKDKICVLEIGEQSLKYLEGEWVKGELVLEKPLLQSFPSPIEENLPQAFEEFFGKIPSSKKIGSCFLILVIPRSWVMMKQVCLPTSNPQEIKEMLSLQSIQQTPYSSQELVFDAQIVEETAGGSARVLWVMAQKKLFDGVLARLSQRGLIPRRICLSSSGICEAIKSVGAVKKIGLDLSTLIIDVDEKNSECCFLHNQSLAFSKSMAWGNGHLRRMSENFGKKSLEDFLQQLDWAMNAYHRGNMGGPLEQIIILSRTLEAVVLKEEIAKRYGFSTHLIDPESLHISSQQEEVSLMASLGSMRLSAASTLNFLPAEIKGYCQRREKQKVLWQCAAALGFLLIAAGGFLGVEFYRELRLAQKIDSQLGQIEPQVRVARHEIEFLSLLEKQLHERIWLADVMKEIYEHTPESIEFSNLHFDESKVLAIQGISTATKDVNEFRAQLAQSLIFKEVTLQYVQRKRRFDKEISDFKIVCRIK